MFKLWLTTTNDAISRPKWHTRYCISVCSRWHTCIYFTSLIVYSVFTLRVNANAQPHFYILNDLKKWGTHKHSDESCLFNFGFHFERNSMFSKCLLIIIATCICVFTCMPAAVFTAARCQVCWFGSDLFGQHSICLPKCFKLQKLIAAWLFSLFSLLVLLTI